MTPKRPERPPWDEVCEQFRGTLRRQVTALGVARLVVFVLAAVALCLFLDWRYDLNWSVRLLLLVLVVAGAVVAVTFELRRHLRRQWSDAEVLRYLDSLNPEGRDALLVLHELHHGDGVVETHSETGQALLNTALGELDPALAVARPREAVKRERVKRWQMGAVGTVLVAVALTAGFSSHVTVGLWRFINPFATTRWPRRTYIDIGAPFDGRKAFVAQGQSFSVKARISGVEIPREVTLYSKPKEGDNWAQQQLAVSTVEGEKPEYLVEHTFEEVNDSIEFYLEGGDGLTRRHDIEVIPAPELVKIQATYHYPTYANRQDLIKTGGDLSALQNTTVDLEFTASTPLKEAVFELKLGEDTPVSRTLTIENNKVCRTSLKLVRDGSYQVRLLDQNGLKELRDERYDIAVEPDEPPMVEIIAPDRNIEATPRAAPRVQFRATDDFGLKEVKFMVASGGDTPAKLTDRITGPIPQTGLSSSQTFSWDLGKQDLKVPARLTFWVTARDCNPVGTGTAESRRLQIDVLKPSEFHLKLFERAKSIIAEARLAFANQKDSFLMGLNWPTKGSGELEDEFWLDLTDKQRRSIRAAARMKDLLQELNTEIEQNRMSKELATGRLNVIGKLLDDVVRAEHPTIDKSLRKAVPRTEAEAQIDALKAKRTTALAGCGDNQKMATVKLLSLLSKLYDWRDLQNAYVQTTLLVERQDEITGETHKVAPLYIGKEPEDLTDPELEQLLRLGKQQKAIYESEDALEKELITIMRNAQKNRRPLIMLPIQVAHRRLRDEQVNEKLKDAWLKIENNQPSMITNKQQEAVAALEVVQRGLAVAGADVKPDGPTDLARVDVTTLVDPELPTAAGTTGNGGSEDGSDSEGSTVTDLTGLGQVLKPPPPPAEDALALSIATLIDLQNAVNSRTEYLSKNNGKTEMPRFVSLKLGMLRERQGDAFTEADKSLKLADEAAKKTQLPQPIDLLKSSRGGMTQVASLLKAGDVTPGNQFIQRDLVGGWRDLLGFLSRQYEVNRQAEEHIQGNHMDVFQRKFRIGEKDLPVAVKTARALDHAGVLQGDVRRTVERLRTAGDTTSALVKKVEKANGAAAGKRQEAVGALLASVQKAFGEFTPEIAEWLNTELELSSVAGIVPEKAAERVGGGQLDENFVTQLGQGADLCREKVRRLMFLIDEREAPPPMEPVAAGQGTTTRKAVSEEDYLKSITPEALSDLVKKSAYLSPALRERMLESLKFQLNPKYKRALGAYVKAVAGKPKAEEEDKEPEGGTNE